jgi:hypothetical protein
MELVPRNNLIEDEKEMLKNLCIEPSLSLRKRVFRIGRNISATFELSVESKDFITIGLCNKRKQNN